MKKATKNHRQSSQKIKKSAQKEEILRLMKRSDFWIGVFTVFVLFLLGLNVFAKHFPQASTSQSPNKADAKPTGSLIKVLAPGIKKLADTSGFIFSPSHAPTPTPTSAPSTASPSSSSTSSNQPQESSPTQSQPSTNSQSATPIITQSLEPTKVPVRKSALVVVPTQEEVKPVQEPVREVVVSPEPTIIEPTQKPVSDHQEVTQTDDTSNEVHDQKPTDDNNHEDKANEARQDSQEASN